MAAFYGVPFVTGSAQISSRGRLVAGMAHKDWAQKDVAQKDRAHKDRAQKDFRQPKTPQGPIDSREPHPKRTPPTWKPQQHNLLGL